ncbi:MAG: hypothetical protein LBH04_08270 [Tannerellaceae bacterium]|jgi:hypothetical protein|nr:hypothetical protein [Tannerellaceae bacterium]
MKQADSIAAEQISYLFFLNSKDTETIYYAFRVSYFDHPICIDTNDELNKLNHFPLEESFHTFLLDKENKVIALGNPVLGDGIKNLYLNRIKGR